MSCVTHTSLKIPLHQRMRVEVKFGSTRKLQTIFMRIFIFSNSLHHINSATYNITVAN